MRPWVRVIGVGVVVAVGTAVLLQRPAQSHVEVQPAPMPLVLEQVQVLGELHTARYTYQNVFEHRSSRQPEEWTRYVPGAASLVRASTRNTALVGITGQVEAGVDLSKARLDEGDSKRLILPAAKIYRPHVDAKVYKHRSGALWNDANLPLKAVAATEERLIVAASKQGIVTEAEKNAREQLRVLVPELAGYEIVFDRG
jgi:hypothetical protein